MNATDVKKLMKMPRTDEGNAQRLHYIFGHKWKYLPQYKNWMFWNGHCWEGRKTADLWWFARDAFRQLAVAIYQLPVPLADEAEQEYRVGIIGWLTKSQNDYHVRLAVKRYQEMLNEEVAATEK